jgi:hypothetical protein
MAAKDTTTGGQTTLFVYLYVAEETSLTLARMAAKDTTTRKEKMGGNKHVIASAYVF